MNAKETINFLREWERQCYTYSSDLRIKGRIYERKDIIKTVEILTNYFGEPFFETIFHYETSPDKINFLHSLLAHKENLGCVSAVIDAANLIEYGLSNDPKLRKSLTDIKTSPDTFRSFLFELFIFRLLDYNLIPNNKKPFHKNQELEGAILLGNENIVFECAKLYSPSAENIYQLRILINFFVENIRKQPFGKPIILALQFHSNIAKSVAEVKKQFNFFLRDYYKSCTSEHALSFNYHDNYFTIKGYNYHSLERIEIEQNSDNYDITVKLLPPNTIKKNEPVPHRLKINFNQKLTKDLLNEKIKRIIYSKSKQLKNIPHRKIIFLDFEITKEFRSIAFAITSENAIDVKRLQGYIETLKSDLAVCIVIRKYLTRFPKNEIICLAKENNMDLVKFIKSMNFNYMFLSEQR